MTSFRRLAAAGATIALLAVPALACAPAASAAVGTSRAVVDGWYFAFLGRDAETDTGSQYWVDRLDVQAPADVLWAITHSEEFNREEVTSYYETYLDRAPDPGARYWLEGTNAQRFPLEWVEQNIAASAEFVAPAQRRGTLVQQWYAAVFSDDSGREPSSAEIAYWSGRVRALGALGAFRELYYTPEAVSSRIQYTYLGLLERNPSPGEYSYWYPKEIESDINVAVLIASTPEYRNMQQTL